MSRLEAFLDWLLPDDETNVDDVDTEFLLSHGGRYKNLSVGDGDPPWCRCDLCGAQYRLESYPELVEHVAGHNEHGAARVDPFDVEKVTFIGSEPGESATDYASVINEEA